MAAIEIVLKGVLAVIGVYMAVLSVLVLREIDQRSDSAMASLQFHSEKTIGDFLLLLFGTAPLFFGFILYAVGGFLGIDALINLGRTTGIIASAMVTVVMYRWWRRF